MNFAAIIEHHFKSIFKWSAIIGICSLVGVGLIGIYQARLHSKSFIISQVRETVIADVNSQTTASLDGELNRIIKLWSLTEEFPARVDVYLDGKLWAHGGQLHPFSWPYLTDEINEILPSGSQHLKIEVQTNIGAALLRFAVVMAIFGAFFLIVFTTLRRRVEGAVREVTRPLESRVKKITEISENLTNISKISLDEASSDIKEVQAIDSSLRQLVGRIVTLEDNLAGVHFTQGRIDATEHLAHTMKGTIANYQLALESPTLSDYDRGEFDSILSELRTISSDVLEAKKADAARKSVPESEGFSDINVNTVIENLINSNRKKVMKRESEIRFDFFSSGNDVLLHGPSGGFERSLADLLTNAVEAIENRGTITTSFNTEEGLLDLQIQDNGRGIPKEILPTLMSDGVTFGKTEGEGMGLYHARKIFNGMGGDLKIFSREGTGTIIKIKLPLKKSIKRTHELVLFPGHDLVVVDDDLSIHKFFNKKLISYKETNKIVSILSPLAFEDWLSKNKNELETMQFIFDVQFEGSPISGIDLIEKHGLNHQSVIISGIAQKANIITEAARLQVRLIHKDDLNEIKIKLENETEETYQEQKAVVARR